MIRLRIVPCHCEELYPATKQSPNLRGDCFVGSTLLAMTPYEVFMIRKTFENEIQLVKDEVLLLGSMVEHAIIASVEVLKKRDIKGAEKIIAEDL